MTAYKLFSRAMLLAVLFTITLVAGCKKDDDDNDDNLPKNTDGLVLVASGYPAGSGTFVKLWATDSLYAGYNHLYVQVLDSVTDEEITDAHVGLMPMMDMGSMMHSAPYENPASEIAVNGLYPCAVVFQMPGEMGWTLDVAIHNHVNNNEGEVTLPISVKTPAQTRVHVFTAANDSAKLIVSYVGPKKPVVGINDFEIAIHKMASMMSFPAADDYTVEIEPEMPSMGHGSPNNENPVLTENGHYKGKVNFTMTGDWRINMVTKKSGAVADSTKYFDVTL
jgi:hypothetical protein